MELPPLFFDQHPNPMLIYDFNTLEILEVNEKATEKYGFSREEFRKLTIEDIRPPEDISVLRAELKKFDKKMPSRNAGTYRHQTKSGDILYVQISAQHFPLKHRDARIVHIHDLTETIQLKNKVEEAYHEQRHHIDNNPLGMVKYDQNFRIIEWSKRAEEKTGYTKEEVLGNYGFELGIFDEEEAEFVKKRITNISSNNKNKDRFETAIRLKDGSKMHVRVHASALRDEDDNLKSVLAFIENISERKIYESQLEERERKYHRLFEDANDGIFLLRDLNIIDCNQRVTDLFEASKEELIGKTPLDFSPDTQPDGTLSKIKAREKINFVQEGKPQVFEWKHHTKNDKNIDVEVSLNTIELGENRYIQAILRDLTEQKKMKSELEAEQQRLKRAQKLARIGWWSYKADDNRVVWSDVLFEILDIDKSKFGGTFESFSELVHPDDREKLHRVMKRARKTTEPLNYTLRIGNRNDDKLRYAKCRAQSEFDSDGQFIKMSGVLQDVTEQKKAQAELQRRERLFESLFVNSPVAIAMIDVDGNVQKINHSFEKLFGYTQKELIGKDLLRHQLPEDRYDEIEEIYGKVFAEEGTSKYYEDQRVTKEGEVKDLLVGALPVVIDGEPIAAFGIYTDITKLRKTEHHLKTSLKEKEVLLSEIHHRVKNNLAIISGLLLLESMNWDEDSEAYSVLMQSKLRIHSMASIHEQLYKSKDFSSLSLEDYVHDLVEMISESMQHSEERVQIDIDCDDVVLNINQALPCALIINELVTNAFKYAFNNKEKGKLAITFKSKNDFVTLSIKDNGPGLPDNFENMTEQSLGHRLVSQLVKQLEGEITVESEAGAGTRYQITFEKKHKSGSSSNYLG